jgi:hypothetical protein
VPPTRSARFRRLFALGLAAAAAARGALWVSPSGSDANPGTEEEPLRTIERARDVVRTLNRDMTDDITVFVGGVHRLAQPIAFGPEDSASNGFAIIYTSAPGEHPVLSGGFRVQGWSLVDRSLNLWWAPAPVGLDDTRDFFVNGVPARRTRGRLLSVFSGNPSGSGSGAPDLSTHWRNASDVVFPPLDPAAIWSERAGKPPFFVENAFELLGAPGEWYLDRAARKIYYTPRPGEDMATADTEAAAADRLIVGAGSRSQPLAGLVFKGIRFELTTTARAAEAPAPETADGADPSCALRFSLAENIQFLEDDFLQLGAGGLVLGPAVRGARIEGCLFGEIAGTAARIRNSRQVHVADCRFSYVSTSRNQGAAIDLDRSEAVVVEHDRIDHYPRFALLPLGALSGSNSASRNLIGPPAINYDGRPVETDPREPDRPDAGITSAYQGLNGRPLGGTTVPQPPGNLAAAPGDRFAYVTWDPPCQDGGSPVSAYVVASSGGARARVTAAEFQELGYAVIGGLENGHPVNFTVAALNATGSSPPSVASANVTPSRNRKLKVPPPPGSATVSTGFGEATFQIVPPASDGGSPVIAYSFTRVPSGVRVVFEGWDVIHADPAHPVVRAIKGFALGSGSTIAIGALNAAGEGKPAMLKLQR